MHRRAAHRALYSRARRRRPPAELRAGSATLPRWPLWSLSLRPLCRRRLSPIRGTACRM